MSKKEEELTKEIEEIFAKIIADAEKSHEETVKRYQEIMRMIDEAAKK